MIKKIKYITNDHMSARNGRIPLSVHYISCGSADLYEKAWMKYGIKYHIEQIRQTVPSGQRPA
jgi:hypothetical protein